MSPYLGLPIANTINEKPTTPKDIFPYSMIDGVTMTNYDDWQQDNDDGKYGVMIRMMFYFVYIIILNKAPSIILHW